VLMIIFESTIMAFGQDSDLFVLQQCKMVTSRIDGTPYCVQESDQYAADLLSELNLRILVFLRLMKAKYVKDAHIMVNSRNMTLDATTIVTNILSRYNQDNIIENVARPHSTSFTIDKGSITGVCVKNPNGQYIDINTLVFVMLHEISHLAIASIDHTDEFWATFAFILSESNPIYTYVDYRSNPVNYCTLIINSNP